MRKIIKWGFIFGLTGVLAIVVLLEGTIAYVSRTEWFKTRVTEALQSALGRDMNLAHMGASLRGIYVDDLVIAEHGGFEKGTFAQLGRLWVHLSWWHLFHGHAKVDRVVLSDVHVYLTVNEDGSASWADLILVDTPQESNNDEGTSALGLQITAQRVRLEQLYIQYTDKQAGHTAQIDGFTIDVHNFSLHKPFKVNLYGNLVNQTPSVLVKIPLTLQAKVHLKELDFSQAYVELQKVMATYAGTSAMLTGKVENWLNPQATLSLKVRYFSNKTLAPWVDAPEMNLDTLHLASKLALDLEKQALTVHHLKVEAPGLKVQGKGGLLYGSAKPIYDFSVQLNGVLGEIGRWLLLVAEPYRFVGTVQTELAATKEKWTAHVKVEDVGGLVPQAGRFSNITGQISAWETPDFKTGQLNTDLTGKFQGNPLTLKLDATQTAQQIEAVLKAYAKELVWQIPPGASTESPEQTSAEDSSSSTVWPYPPLNLQADVKVDQLQVPYFYGTQLAFTADVKSLTPDLKQAHGMVHLSAQNGKIQDLYKLTNANPLTKVLFMSLNVTGKVFNSLNVLGVLKNLGGGFLKVVKGNKRTTSTGDSQGEVKTQTILGPDGEPLEVEVGPATQVGGGEMAYDKFDTQVDFVNGKATVKKGTFVSTMMSLRLDGTTDFNTNVVDLTVHAAPGRHEVNGMMPLTLKIGGTVDEPVGKMQLLGSVASLVKQGVANNVISRQVTKGVKGVINLFKKKEETEPTEPAEPTAQAELMEQAEELVQE